MKIAMIVAITAVAAGTGIVVVQKTSAADGKSGALPGSPSFLPTPENPIGWRGDGTGHYPGATKPPTQWAFSTNGVSKNISYMAPLYGYSPALPIIVGQKIFVTTYCDLVCLDKNTGKVLWAKCCNLFKTLGAEEVKKLGLEKHKQEMEKHETILDAWAKNPKEPPAQGPSVWHLDQALRKADKKYECGGGWGACCPAAATPTSDGKFVWVFLSETGSVCCYDLDGKLKWARFYNSGGCEHNVSSSPLLVGDRLILYGGGVCYGIDKIKGDMLWKTAPNGGKPYASPVAGKIGNTKVAVLASGAIINPADGATVVAPGEVKHDGECASAVVNGDLYHIISRTGYTAMRLPGGMPNGSPANIVFRIGPIELRPPEGTNPYYPYPVASPVAGGGIVYFTHNGASDYYKEKNTVLFAVDEKTGKLLYRKELTDLKPRTSYDTFGGGQTASLTVAGKYLYVMDNVGITIVVEVGKAYKQVAVNSIKNKISRWGMENELTISTPIFEGSKMYYRAYDNLYCIGE